MVIVLKSMVVVKFGEKPTLKIVDVTVFQKYDNYHDFGFDVYKPENWKKYLDEFKIKGKLLPRKTKEGFRVAYIVHFFGMPKEFPKHTSRGAYYNLFPGYDENGVGKAPIFHGYLD